MPALLGAGWAGAIPEWDSFATKTQVFTYTNLAGQTVTCAWTAHSASNLASGRGDALAVAAVNPDDPGCNNLGVSVSARFRYPDGTHRDVAYADATSSVRLEVTDPAATDFIGYHIVSADDCTGTATSPCYMRVVTHPK
jgi:hypothetical protein